MQGHLVYLKTQLKIYGPHHEHLALRKSTFKYCNVRSLVTLLHIDHKCLTKAVTYSMPIHF